MCEYLSICVCVLKAITYISIKYYVHIYVFCYNCAVFSIAKMNLMVFRPLMLGDGPTVDKSAFRLPASCTLAYSCVYMRISTCMQVKLGSKFGG